MKDGTGLGLLGRRVGQQGQRRLVQVLGSLGAGLGAGAEGAIMAEHSAVSVVTRSRGESFVFGAAAVSTRQTFVFAV
jgi:hypothetical protein